MTELELVAALIDELDDVVSELRLYDLGDLLGVGKAPCDVGEGGVELHLAHVVHLASLACGTGVLAVEDGERGEAGGTVLYALSVVAELFLHAVDLLLLDVGMFGEELHFDLRGDEGQRVLGHVLEEMAHLGGADLDVLRQMLAHECHGLVVLDEVVGLFADLRHRHAPVLFELLLGACGLHPLVDLRLDVAVDLVRWGVDAVNLCLVEEELLDGQVLGDDTIGVAADACHLGARFLDVAQQDGLVADDPDHLIDGVGQPLCVDRRVCSCDEERDGHESLDMFTHQCLLTVLIASS